MTELDTLLAPQAAKVELPDIPVPPDTSVVLPAGFWDMKNDVVIKNAEVRELTGLDEEVLARVADKNPRKFFATILERGTVKIGDDPATPAVLSQLTVGDIDALLLGIRYVTYGENLELSVTCPSCKSSFDVDINLPAAIPVKELKDGFMFDVTLRDGRVANCRLANFADQNEIMDGKDRTAAEVNSLLLSHVVTMIDDMTITLSDIRALGVKDRQTLISAIADHTPGPQLERVKQPCQECAEEIPLPLSMADLFQLL